MYEGIGKAHAVSDTFLYILCHVNIINAFDINSLSHRL